MLRVRLLGHNGQSIKTASQILGTTSFLRGYQSQGFPLYGAERRGVSIATFARITPKPILERGPIPIPDLLMDGDKAPPEDPRALSLCGSDNPAVVFVNSTKDLKSHNGGSV